MARKRRDKTIRLLARAWEHVDSVDYRVSARWLFYQLLQESFYSHKDDYHDRFLPLVSSVRKKLEGPWRPDTLADETRSPIRRGEGFIEKSEALKYAMRAVNAPITHWKYQDNYVEIWFEARAMAQQFQYYTEGITLWPFAGDASIPYKWQMAESLRIAKERFEDKPIAVLYFGDCDKKGLEIPYNAHRDVVRWSGVDFDFRRCGLTIEQAETYNVPENPDKPGEYQWEALSDEGAAEIIKQAMADYLNPNVYSQALWETEAIEAQISQKIAELLEED